MDNTNSKLGHLKVQLGQFSTVVDSTHVLVGNIIEIFSNSRKIHGKKRIYLFSVMPVTRARVIIFYHETH